MRDVILHPGLAARNRHSVASLITHFVEEDQREYRRALRHREVAAFPTSSPRPTNSIMKRDKKFATRKVKNVHMFDTSMDTGSIDLCETHEARQSLCQSLRWCLLITVKSLSFLLRGGRIWEVVIDSPAGPSGKSVSISQKEKARQENQFPFLLHGVSKKITFPSLSLSLISFSAVLLSLLSSVSSPSVSVSFRCDLAHGWNT